jgi:phosphatidylglycerol:prolipoprotein diacylglycerol transferase
MLPVIFKIGSFTVSGYLLFYVLGVIFSATTIYFLAVKERFDKIETINLLIYGFIAMVLGSKIYSAIYNYILKPDFYNKNIDKLFENFFGGGVFYGSLISGIIFLIFYLPKFFKDKEWNITDIAVIGGALGHAFGRLGCFSAGCCYGKVSDLPWAVKFPFLAGRPHPFCNSSVHPTQIYESILNFINFLILYNIYKKKKFNGQVFSLYLINYGIIRIFVEFFRNDGGRGYIIRGNNSYLSLSYPQLISLILIISGIIIYKIRNKSTKKYF